jgi:hypothetical protein
MSRSIPFSAILTPATLSVQPTPFTSWQLLQVPQPDYQDPQMCAKTGLANGTCLYQGPSFTTYRSPSLSVMEGDVLSVSSTAKNLSYGLIFNGPAISCVEANNSTSTFVQRAIQDYNNSTGKFLYRSGFVPDENFVPEMNGSFFGLIGNGIPNVSENLDLVSKDAAKIYQTLYFSNTPDVTDLQSPGGVQKVIECSLYNASYEVAFEFKKQWSTNNHCEQISSQWSI